MIDGESFNLVILCSIMSLSNEIRSFFTGEVVELQERQTLVDTDRLTMPYGMLMVCLQDGKPVQAMKRRSYLDAFTRSSALEQAGQRMKLVSSLIRCKLSCVLKNLEVPWSSFIESASAAAGSKVVLPIISAKVL